MYFRRCSSIRVALVAAALLSLVVPASAALAQAPSAKSLDTAAVSAEVEAVYVKLRASVVAKNYDAFVAVSDSATAGMPREYFAQSVPMLLNRFPDLAKLKLQRIAVSGIWIGYYTLGKPSSGGSTDVAYYLFRRDGNQVRISMRLYESEFPNGKDAAETQGKIVKELDTNVKFRLPGQPGYVKQP